MMPFWLILAWRELRSSWRHFVYFLACIALGVGAVLGVSLFSTNVERAVLREARGLLGGDLEIRLSRPLGGPGSAVLTDLASRGIVATRVTELVAMVARVDRAQGRIDVSQLVELKAIEARYPLYGVVRVDPDRPLTELLHLAGERCGDMCHGAVVQEALLIRLGLVVGDAIRIGQASFRITGVIHTEPDRMANMFSLGPRVLVSQEGLAAADLIKPGSRLRERHLLKLPSSVALSPLVHELRGRLAADSARVSSYRDAQPQLKQFLDQLARYLGLVGLTALFVGGIGVALSIHAFVREKLPSIAVLKTVGADTQTIIYSYLGQAVGLGLLGSVAGIGIGVALQAVLPQAVSTLLATDVLQQVEFTSVLSFAAVAPLGKGLGLGVLTTLLFSLWPLLTIRDIKPAAIFRRDVERAGASLVRRERSWWRRAVRLMTADPLRTVTAVGIGIGLAGLSMWQAGSLAIGSLFIGGLLVAIVSLAAAAQALLRGLRALPAPGALSLRQALSNLQRPGGHTLGVMVSIGVGVMVILAIALLQHALVRQVGENRPSDSPTFFFIDIQPDQTKAFGELVHRRTGDLAPYLTPLVRSRIHAINGRTVSDERESQQEEPPTQSKDEKRKSWYANREYVLTFLDHVPKDNTIVKGAWWKPGQVFSRPQVSVEEEAAKSLDLDIGSLLDLNIQGTILQAEVSSIRKVEWGNFSTNFYMIFSPGSLDAAPMTYVATVRVAPQDEVALQSAVVAAFPNVTAINIGEVLSSFARVLDRLSLAIRGVALFCLMAGALVMAAALAATRYQRLYEAVILKALGATRGLIARSFAAEYAVLGCVAGVIGVALASLFAWAILRYILELPWALELPLLGIGLACTVLLTLLVGFLSTYRILGQPPLTVLRHE
ncbi:MAG: FtsX-like permease family protein [Nitrospira sp. CR1.1]|jgi:putative ABC transport system permease protein|nr:FtsX-like permease family protein [Nitrospira sp. CR1.1]